MNPQDNSRTTAFHKMTAAAQLRLLGVGVPRQNGRSPGGLRSLTSLEGNDPITRPDRAAVAKRRAANKRARAARRTHRKAAQR